MRRTALLLIVLSGGTCATAQVNLVKNGSFEELKWPDSEYPCPTSGGAIGQTKFWNSAWGSVDYFNECSNEDWPLWGVPTNIYGVQRPYDGLAYRNLATYTPLFSEAREYLWQHLEAPLKAGSLYRLRFQVSLNDSANFATGHFGALFTFNDTQALIDQMLGQQPQVVSAEGEMFTSKSAWVEIEGEFIAQGGEEYIVIGNFKPDTTTAFERVSSIPITNVSHEVASYYLDAVELYEVSGVGVEEQGTAKFELYPNPTAGPATLQYNTAAQGPLQWQVCDMAGRTVHTQNLQGTQGRATLGIALPSGVYVSNVTANGVRIGSTKLVVL